jgi:hypothetical protein
MSYGLEGSLQMSINIAEDVLASHEGLCSMDLVWQCGEHWWAHQTVTHLKWLGNTVFLFVLQNYVTAVMIKLSRSYDLTMIIRVSEQYS